jgi:hypothetical protein
MTILANSVIFTEASLAQTRQLPKTTSTDNNGFLKAAGSFMKKSMTQCKPKPLFKNSLNMVLVFSETLY